MNRGVVIWLTVTAPENSWGLVIGNVGFGGTTSEERARIHDILAAGHLIDPYLRPLHLADNIPNYTFRGKGKFLILEVVLTVPLWARTYFFLGV